MKNIDEEKKKQALGAMLRQERKKSGKSLSEVSNEFGHYRNFYLPLRRASKKAIGRYIHPHTLRHSYASMMINQGIDIYTLSRLLGHSNIGTTTKVYSHLYKDKLIEISEKLELNGVIK